MSDYLQHGSRHLPTGSDPIPVSALQALGLPSAYFSKTIGSPVTDYLAAQNLAFDTVQTGNPEYFSISGSTGQLTTGFYLCVGMVQFASSATDWSAALRYASLTIGSQTSGTVDLGMNTSYSMGATATYIQQMESVNFVGVGGSGATLTLGFGLSNNSSPLPVGIAVARAVAVRISGQYSITP